MPKEFNGVAFGVLALVKNHGENSLCLEQVANQLARFFGVVFGQVRVAAEFPEYFAEGLIANGIGNQVHVFTVAAKTAVQKLERALMNADGGDRAMLYRLADDFFVFVDDSAFDAFKAGESAVRIERIPEDSLEHVASAYACLYISLRVCKVPYRAPVSSLGVERLVDRKHECE